MRQFILLVLSVFSLYSWAASPTHSGSTSTENEDPKQCPAKLAVLRKVHGLCSGIHRRTSQGYCYADGTEAALNGLDDLQLVASMCAFKNEGMHPPDVEKCFNEGFKLWPATGELKNKIDECQKTWTISHRSRCFVKAIKNE